MNIVHLSKAKVLAALYNNAKSQGLGFLHYDPNKPMMQEEAQKILDGGQTYFDYLQGRVMKIDLSTDELETYLYNRDNGEDRAERVIELLGKELKE